jgi:quercetin dioxygenase-like cupin family protein
MVFLLLFLFRFCALRAKKRNTKGRKSTTAKMPMRRRQVPGNEQRLQATYQSRRYTMGTIHHQVASSDAPGWDYETVALKEYTSGGATPGATRRVLIGRDEGAEDFIMRYFTIPPRGHSAFESHPHQHGVVVTHGRGRVLLGDQWSDIGPGDAVFVEPNEQHQFEALGEYPLGFICVIPKWAKSPTAPE